MPALREPVLAGAFFGSPHASTASRLATFLALPAEKAVREWFGESTGLLAGRPDALRGALDCDIAALDRLIGAQLDALLHHPRLKRLEGSWRGLRWLTDGIDPVSRVRVRVLNVAWPELCRDLERAIEFDQSHLFRKVYEEEFGSPGGEPYGLLLIDREIRHQPTPDQPTDDQAALAALAGIAAAAFAPTVLAASPALLQVDNFMELGTTANLSDPFRGSEFVRWRGMCAREDMRFVALALPRVLARRPWDDDPARPDGFRYAETAEGAGDRVWMGAGYAFAAVVARAFADSAWPADVRGTETDRIGGGLVTNLCVEPFGTDPDRTWVRAALEVVLTDSQERALVDAGLMPLGALPFTEEAAFGAVRSVQALARPAPAMANTPAVANARLSAQLNAILCASRFAHYVKVMGRDIVGAFRTADEIERRLQAWLSGYVNASLTAGPESRARFPLVAARATVRERPGKPGVFGCVIQLQPHHQLDNVAGSFRLVTDIAGIQ